MVNAVFSQSNKFIERYIDAIQSLNHQHFNKQLRAFNAPNFCKDFSSQRAVVEKWGKTLC